MAIRTASLPEWMTLRQGHMDDGSPFGPVTITLSYRGTEAQIGALPETLVERLDDVLEAGVKALVTTLVRPLRRRPALGRTAPDMPVWDVVIPAVRAELLGQPRRDVTFEVSEVPLAEREYAPPLIHN